ncbi:hypothetical protein [Brachybacterium aquaticum]|uniref:SAV-6107-like HEPN domain-containing protein n=1 Tax=Brachybacterium aquaticum TaxID=1432564 RepID=A0A841A9X0_9MICO|nr:hypothetical protein [Brachybacterium aquaticum]MBB5832009.1 hypothetical protein [Brachybacterium aquaticum]
MTHTTARPTTRRTAAPALRSEARAQRLLLARLDQDQADLERARQLLQQAHELAGPAPRESFELVHRAALRCAGVLVARANRERRRALPLNVWTALDRLGGAAAERSAQMAPMVAERMRLDRDPRALPAPDLLAQHLADTAAHLAEVAASLVADLPARLAELTAP